MEDMIEKYIKHFGKEPTIIGLFWSDPKKLESNINKSIKDNNPYNEYEMLTDEEKKLFNEGKLLF